MDQTNKLILIVVETTNKAQTDPAYISKAIREIYKQDSLITERYGYLSAKTNYKSRSIINEIKSKTSGFEEYHIVYCLDTDDIFTDPMQLNQNNEIMEYCRKNNYDVIWFCRDIEEVFLHKKINDTEKLKESKKFSSKKGISSATLQSLSSEGKYKQTSNFTKIFDKYFERK